MSKRQPAAGQQNQVQVARKAERTGAQIDLPHSCSRLLAALQKLKTQNYS